MTDDAWLPDALEARVLELFQLPAETRARELDALCDAEPGHADQIRALAALGASTEHAAAAPPARIGPYRILSVLGEGGMGTVYLAEQETPVQRRVALKLIKLGMDSKQVVARFASERQTLASMNHPNIAQVFDGGLSTEGRPYFVMEYVDGEPIHRFCETHQLDLRARLELFRDVCAGVQHAHQRGVLHRDLKPTNVLVARENQVARPKIIDFGLARAIDTDDTDRSLLTVEGQLLGTPGYMSPEQADASFAAIDTRTDVYSLGIVLYQLLVGKLPFDADSMRGIPLSELQRRIREDEPARPSARAAAIAKSTGEPPVPWIRRLRGDLDCIVMHCLEKEPDRRYRSPAALSED
ncbi:MAG: serine/threonine protein kinase, partial [Planctomycetes bacterium]|nr:serine/threonine protein kinase [Planctomycetota bacterium]